jgi:hypothetical protein
MPNLHVGIRAVFEEYAATSHSMLFDFTVGSGDVTSSHVTATEGTEVTITATADTNNRFVRWEVTVGGITLSDPLNPIQTFIMPDNPVRVRAVFEADNQPISHAVNAHSSVAGHGTVSRSHTTATAGTVVTLTATPNQGYRFVRWNVISGGITVSPPTNRIGTFTMPNNAVTVWAVFEDVQRWGEATFNLSGQMALSLPRQSSEHSSRVSVNVTSLPVDAIIHRISVNVGNSSGTIIPSSLFVKCSSRPEHEMQIPWTGQLNTPIGYDRLDFWNHEANALYEIWWYGTNLSALPDNRTFGNVSLTIEYTYTVN